MKQFFHQHANNLWDSPREFGRRGRRVTTLGLVIAAHTLLLMLLLTLRSTFTHPPVAPAALTVDFFKSIAAEQTVITSRLKKTTLRNDATPELPPKNWVLKPTREAQQSMNSVSLPSHASESANESNAVANEASLSSTSMASAMEPRVTQATPIEMSAPRFDANYLDNPAPQYPALSRRAGEEGKVILRVYVETTGVPSRVDVSISSGYERLDKSAMTAVSRWKFVAARQGDHLVAAWVLVPVVFSLKKQVPA